MAVGLGFLREGSIVERGIRTYWIPGSVVKLNEGEYVYHSARFAREGDLNMFSDYIASAAEILDRAEAENKDISIVDCCVMSK